MYRVQGGDQKEYGPISADQVQQWIHDRRLNRFSLCAGADGIWKPLGQFLEFSDTLASVAPPAAGPAIASATMGEANGRDQAGRAGALQRVKAPAITLLVVSILLAIYSLANVVTMASGKLVSPALPGMDENTRKFMESYFDFLSRYGWMVSLLGAFSAGLGIVASLRLKSLRSFGLVTVAAIAAMLPCFSSCCCIGLPMGIWVVVIMNRSDVKPYFE